MSRLLELQFEFSEMASLIVPKAVSLGYKAKLGECLRSNEQAEIHALGRTGRSELVAYLARMRAWDTLAVAISDNAGSGIRLSQHRRQLAIDIQLFRNGFYLTRSSDYRPIGDWWVSLHPLARWGGNFSSPDGAHFSFEWEGVQ